MPKRILEGKVIKNKSEKTIIVDVESTYIHKKYKKYLKKIKNTQFTMKKTFLN